MFPEQCTDEWLVFVLDGENCRFSDVVQQEEKY